MWLKNSINSLLGQGENNKTQHLKEGTVYTQAFDPINLVHLHEQYKHSRKVEWVQDYLKQQKRMCSFVRNSAIVLPLKSSFLSGENFQQSCCLSHMLKEALFLLLKKRKQSAFTHISTKKEHWEKTLILQSKATTKSGVWRFWEQHLTSYAGNTWHTASGSKT